MEIIKVKAKAQREIFADILADALHIPEEVKKDLMELSHIEMEIHSRMRENQAINHGLIGRYNSLCYKCFPKDQDGEEFEKEEPEETENEKVPNCERRFDFGEAIRMLKDGCRLSRDGWNGKDQYIILAKNITFDTYDARKWPVLHEAIGNQAIAFVGTSGVQMGWLASQADMLAEDWHCVEVKK